MPAASLSEVLFRPTSETVRSQESSSQIPHAKRRTAVVRRCVQSTSTSNTWSCSPVDTVRASDCSRHTKRRRHCKSPVFHQESYSETLQGTAGNPVQMPVGGFDRPRVLPAVACKRIGQAWQTTKARRLLWAAAMFAGTRRCGGFAEAFGKPSTV